MRIISYLLVAVVFFSSCNQFEKAKSGMKYKITSSDSKKPRIKSGQIVKFNLEYKVKTASGKDSILNSTFGKMPIYHKFDFANLPKYDFAEVLAKLAVGDKVEFLLDNDSLKSRHMIPDYNEVFVKGGHVEGRVEILKVYDDEKVANEEYKTEMMAANQKEQEKIEKESAGETAKEKARITKYVADNKLTTVVTQGGVQVVVENAGEGQKADSGWQASVMYKGYTLDGKVFDANMGADAKHTDPFNVVLGQHRVIRGWEEGLKLFGKGGKGKLIIPFILGYGPQGSPPVIPAYSTLVFDVEIKDVTKPAPEAAAPKMPAHGK